MTETTGTNRDRVRRLVFEALGFRWPKAVPEAEGIARLNRIADEIAYMSDDGLEALARMMRPHGQGSARNFWPDRASFLSFAHIVQPLPLEDDPKLLSWLASVEGDRILAEGTQVETWEYFERRRVPPATDQARQIVARQASDAQGRLRRIDEKVAAGWYVDAQDLAWSRHYRARRAHIEQVLREARAARVSAQSRAQAGGAA